MLKKIIQISDIHIFLNKKFEAHDYVFNQFYKQMEIEKPELIVCTGDLIDSKLRLSPEQIDLARKLLYNLSVFCPLIIILGNHDLNLANPERLDSISPIVHSLYSESENPIHFFKNSGIYECYGIDWAVWSCLDNQQKPNITNKNYTIGLYHGTVKNCISESGFVLTEGIDIDEFKDCQNVFLGDIHLYQTFRNQEIAYSSSFIQTKISEEVDGNYLVWEWNGKKYFPTSKKIKNIYSTVTTNIKELFKTELNKTQNYIFKYDPELVLKSDIQQLKKQYKDFKIEFSPIIEKKNKVILNIDNKKENLITSLNDYLEYLNIENKNEIISLDNKYNSNLDLSKDYEYGDFSILNLKVSNFLCFGLKEQIIDFDKSGLFGISGQNKSGKSSLMNAIEFVLFNSTKNNSSTLRKLINKHNRDKECYVEILIEKNGIEYIIKRKLIPKKVGGVTIELDFYEVGGKSLKGEKRQETEKEIQKFFGTESSFEMMSFYSAQKKQVEFMDCKNAERLSLINRFLGLQYYELKEKEVSEEIKIKKAVLLELQKQIDKFDTVEKIINDIITEESELQTNKKTLEDEKNNFDLLNLKNKYLVETYDFYKNIANREYKEINEIEEFINLKNNKKIALEEKISFLNKSLEVSLELPKLIFEFEEKYKVNTFEYKKSYNDIKPFESKISILENDIFRNKKQLEIDICKNCGKNFTEENKNEVKNKIVDLHKELELTKKELIKSNDYNDNIKSCVDKIKEIENIVRIKKQEKIELENQILKIELEIKNESEQISKYEEIKNARNKISEIKNDYDIYIEKRNIFQKNIETINDNIKNNTKNIEKNNKLKSDVIKIIDRYNELDVENNLLKQYKEIINKSSLPLFILKNKIQDINSQINLIVGQIFDFEIEFEINQDAGELDITFFYPEDKEKDDVGFASGSETFIINLCIKVGLSQVSEIPKLTSLLIDEGYGTLDENNLEKIPNLFNVLPKYYKNIITVSHIDKLKELYEYEINVKKIGDYSIILQ